MKEEKFDVEEDMDVEDVAYEAHHKIDALLDLLVKKGVITEDEFEEQIDKLVEEMEDDDDDCECDDKDCTC
ncbi:MAG: hypothetical protein ABIJ18_04810 [archaeon]